MQEEIRPNITLTGFMGTGKTTVGKLLAERLDYNFVDTDALIEERSGRTIPSIFAEDGEAVFRQMEAAVAVELAQQSGLVIATGGGLLMNQANAAALAKSGHVFCLTASVDTILTRTLRQAQEEPQDATLNGSRNTQHAIRPLLQVTDPTQRIQDLLAARAEQYAQFTQIPTDDLTPEQVVDKIIRMLRSEFK